MELLGDVSFLDALETVTDITPFEIPGIDLPTAAAGADIVHGPRPYRSRKNRPCDFCRARKAACKITVAPPCTLCSSYGKECTFNNQTKRKRSVVQLVEDTPKRRRTETSDQDNDDNASHSLSPQSNSDSQSWSMARNNTHRRASHAHAEFGSSHRGTLLEPALDRTMKDHGARRPEISFALHPTKSLNWVGDSGEADPWLCRRYEYDADGHCVLSRITYQRVDPEAATLRRRGINEGYDEPPLVFMLPDDALAAKGEPRVEDSTIEDLRKEVMDLVPEDVGVQMLKLVFRFVYPYFPVLSRENMLSGGDLKTVLQSLPLSLLSAIYATALPFMLYDDYLATAVVHSAPSAIQLYRICWTAICQEMHSPRLATLQACLLVIQRPPTNRFIMDTPWKWSCTAWTVSLANILGLCKSSTGWSGMPAWEKRLRGRLWWATYSMDKWSLLGAGMPSHIDDDNFDVPEPTLDLTSGATYVDMLSPGRDSHDPRAVPAHFYHLVTLTMTLSDIVKAFYSIRATSQTARNLDLSLERAKPLRARLRDWREASRDDIASTGLSNLTRNDSQSPEASTYTTLKEVDHDNVETLDGNASLRLAYIIAVMTLYRALLRAMENTAEDFHTDANYAGRIAVLAGAKECAKEAVEFAEDLRNRGSAGVWDAFWHSWSRSNFALATSFLMRVLVNINASHSFSRDEDLAEIKALISRWRRVLRLMSGNAGNGMTSLALLRLEGDLLQEPALLRLQ